jgi:hypothetical protein
MRNKIAVAAAAAWLGVLAGCGAGPGADVVITAQVDTISGVERWIYPGEAGAPNPWQLDTVALIGGAMVDDDAYQFNGVPRDLGLAGDADGNLYVLDQMGSRVLKYDAHGRYLGRFGRKGNGPGELGSPVGLALGPGDSIWVADMTNGRLVIYPQDGGEPRSMALGEGPIMPGVGFALRRGGVVHDFRPFTMMRMTADRRAGAPPAPPREQPRVVQRMSPGGTVLDTLWLYQPPEPIVAQSGGSDNRVMVRTSRAFEPTLNWAAFSDGGIATSDSAEYILHLVDHEGNLVRRIQRDLPAREVTEADKEIARNRLKERMASGGGMRVAITVGGGGGGGVSISSGSGPAMPAASALMEAQLKAMTFAPVVPRIIGVRVDPADRLWVGVSLENPGDTDRIDIYDREGRLIKELTGQPLPEAFLTPDLAVRLVQDEFEVEQILIYRLPRLDTVSGAAVPPAP